MREIKFKVWDNTEKEFMKLEDYQEVGAIEVENDGALTLSPRFRFLTSMAIMPDRFIPLEYTGLKDKNGVEIYEGDILKGIEFNFIIKWNIHRMGFSLYPTKDLALYDEMPVNVENKIPYEVIGNIYDNPDLLDSKESE